MRNASPCALLAVAILACGVVAGCGSSSRPTATGGMQRYHDSAGWVLAYPRAFHLEHSTSSLFHDGVAEVTVGSFPMPSPGACPSEWFAKAKFQRRTSSKKWVPKG